MRTSSIADAGVRLWAVVTRLTSSRSQLGLRDRADLRLAALGAIAAINGRPPEAGERIGRDEARAVFTAIAVELARAGIDNADLAAWLDESWADRRLARREA